MRTRLSRKEVLSKILTSILPSSRKLWSIETSWSVVKMVKLC